MKQDSTTFLVKASGLIALFTILSKVFGFVRETVIARAYGATWLTDSYLVAYTIPSLLFASVGAAIVSAVIPIFSEVRDTKGKEEAFRYLNNLFWIIMIAVGVLLLAGEIFAPVFVKLLAPGFTSQAFTLAVSLTRILFPTILFLALSSLFTAVLNAQKQFLVPAATGFPYNLLIITAVLLFAAKHGIFALAVSTVLAVGSQALIQLPALTRAGFRPQWASNWRDPLVRKFLVLIGPVVISWSGRSW